ncbi:MAG: anti-sigma factor family protein [Vicinamibacterales bacterium]
MTHLSDDELVLHYYGELSSAEQARTESHLSACRDCQQGYARLQRVMAAVDSSMFADAPAGFERTAWARLEPALGVRRGRLAWFAWSPGLAWVAAIVLLVAGAFAAGRLTHPTAPTATMSARAGTNEAARQRVLLVDLGEHLDQSQRVLVELASAEADPQGLDISRERDRAQQLLAANRLYRQTAVNAGDPAMASLLEDLERVLVDVAAGPATMSKGDLDSIQKRISDKALLFKVGVVSTQVHERERAAFRERRPLDTTKG